MYHFSCIIYIVLPLLRVSITPYKYHLTQIDILRGLTFTINNSQQFILLIVYCSYSNLCALVVKLKGLTSMVIQGENINIKKIMCCCLNFKTNKTKDFFKYFFLNWCISKVVATSLLVCCRLFSPLFSICRLGSE